MASSKHPPPPPLHLPHKHRSPWLDALGRQVDVLEAIARNEKLPAPERLHAIELIARLAGARVDKPKPPKHHDDDE